MNSSKDAFTRYEVWTKGNGVSCGPAEGMDAPAWVSEPCRPWAFGKFFAACTSVENAQKIADAMNAVTKRARRKS